MLTFDFSKTSEGICLIVILPYIEYLNLRSTNFDGQPVRPYE